MDSIEVSGSNGRDGTLEKMSILYRLAPGSEPVHVENMIYRELTYDSVATLKMRESAIAKNDVFTGYFTASDYPRDMTTVAFEDSPPALFYQNFPSPWTSAMMIGKVAIALVFVESTDVAPAGNLENWTDEEVDMLKDDAVDAMNWWNEVEPRAAIRHTFDVYENVEIPHEPITIDPSVDDEWINDTLDELGVDPAVNHIERIRNWADKIRKEKNAHWGFVLFMVDSNDNGNPGFPNGWGGYAYVNGPYAVVASDACSGCANMIAAHEIGHVFGALDEYASSGCNCDDGSGFYNIENENCDNGCLTNTTSIMGSKLVDAYLDHKVSLFVLGQMGLIDADNNLYLDPVDHLFTTPNPGSGIDNQTVRELVQSGYDKPDFSVESIGFYAYDYLKKGPLHHEGRLQNGDILQIMHESSKKIEEDQEVNLIMIPKTGNSLNIKFITPQVISEQRMYLYPLK